MKSKYVAGRVSVGFGSANIAIVFPEVMEHAKVARDLEFLEVSSAGFVDVSTEDEEVHIRLYGQSISLGVVADDKDEPLVRDALGLNYY